MIEIKLDADDVVARKPAKERPAPTNTLALVAQIAWHFASGSLLFMVSVGALLQLWRCK
jgi:hypothetical protein